jgi:hypothetical protein
MEKEFVPYELALRMKRLGFDEPCFGYYNEGTLSIEFIRNGNIFKETEDSIYFKENTSCLAPTFSQAFSWFREKHSLFSSILPFQDIEDDIRLCYYYCVINLDECKDEDILCNESSLGASDINFSSPAEAELACLEKLIGILEKRNADMTEHGVYK